MSKSIGSIELFPIRVYVSHTDISDDLYRIWYERMPDKRRERADRFRMQDDRKRCILAYALLEHATGELLEDYGIECSGSGYTIEESESGKPYYADLAVHFNISHAGERVMVALSPREVGCDVEQKSKSALSIAKRFFAKEEYEMLSGLDKAQAESEFTRLWTIKESVLKCCGDGIGRAMNDFCLVGNDGKVTGTVRLPGADEKYHIKEYAAESGYRFSACSIYDDFEERIRIYDPGKVQ